MEITKAKRNGTKTKSSNSRELNILVVDDHKIIRDGLTLMLENINNPKYIVYTAASIIDAKDILLFNQIDVALVDFRIGQDTGDKLIEFIRKEYETVKCIAISGYDESDYIYKMLKAGAGAYVIKNISETELNDCIAAVRKGKTYYSKEIINAYLQAGKKLVSHANLKIPEVKTGLQALSDREIEIIKLIALEMTNEEIAQFLNISARTVGNHRTNILTKINARNTVGLIKFAVENDLLD